MIANKKITESEATAVMPVEPPQVYLQSSTHIDMLAAIGYN